MGACLDILVVACLCLINATVMLTREPKLPYMGLKLGATFAALTPLGNAVEAYLTFLVAYSNLIPISLYVGIEVMKLVQKFLIEADLEMLHHRDGTRAKSRTSNLVEELGQVEYIFSDKTGPVLDLYGVSIVMKILLVNASRN
jgi:phospholipid-transporting ATPase